MCKSFLYILIVTSLSVVVSAQPKPRVFDNFDTSKGVQVITSEIRQPVMAIDKKLVKKTGKSMAVNEGLSSYNSASRVRMAAERSMGNFTTGDSNIDSYILDSSKKYDIDPLLIYSQMHQESSFKVKATSNKGASGLMQLMPATARRFGVTKIYDPKQNIEAGIRYMRWLLDTFNGDVVLALAGYNAGEGAVMKYRNQIPPYRETQEYVRRISERYNTIINPNLPRMAVAVTKKEAKTFLQKESVPLSVYERDILTIKTSDGKLRLVNQ